MHRAAYGLRLLRVTATLSLLLAATVGAPARVAGAETGVLKVALVDEATGKPVPARVELLDAGGKAYIADDALLVGTPSILIDRESLGAWRATRGEVLAVMSRKVVNNYTRTEQFYADGRFQLGLPAGKYRLRVFKGLEYRIAAREIEITTGATLDLNVPLVRWINLQQQGWYAADAHVHVARPNEQINPEISRWMQAEDLHVANILQWGNSHHFNNTWQYAHGRESIYHEGDYWLATGQENPRSHILGHTLTFGASAPIHFPDNYLVYKQYWDEARRQNAVTGWAHFADFGGQVGVPIDLLDGLVDFIEVLQFDRADYSVWYDALNLGARVAPVGGTDYPAGPYLPGRERFYTHVEGKLDYGAWLDGLRRGRTFVTNGPLLEFTVNGKGMGDEVRLDKRATVTIEARVRFDSSRDDVRQLELLADGQVIRRFDREADAAEIVCRYDHPATKNGWLAVRVAGKKLAEPNSPYEPKHQYYQERSPALAHSAAIYVTVAGRPPVTAQPQAKAAAQDWIDRLDALQRRLSDDQIEKLARWPSPRLDGVDLATLRNNRPALLERIHSAKRRLQAIAEAKQ
jgi:hypothetical protein